MSRASAIIRWLWRSFIAGCAATFLVSCVWFLLTLYAARQQRRAIEDMKRLGATAFYDFQCEKGASRPTAIYSELLGPDFFSPVTALHLPRRLANDDMVREATRFPYLKELIVSDSPVTDGGLAYLTRLPRLAGLFLAGCRITDDGLASVGKLRALKELSLVRIPITDRGIEHLMGLSQLESVDLSVTRVTIKGVESLCRLPRMRRLNVGAYIINDPVAARLRRECPQCALVGPPGAIAVDYSEYRDKRRSTGDVPTAQGQEAQRGHH